MWANRSLNTDTHRPAMRHAHTMAAVHRNTLALLFAGASALACAAPAKLLGKPPPELADWRAWEQVPREAFYEIPASRAAQAAEWLEASDVLLLEKERDTAVYFSQSDATCSSPRKLVLLRANYINGATGAFSVSWAGDAIVVAHAFLGPGSSVHETALIACLSKVPKRVYGVTSGAM
jgi:hypothetical protein